MYGHEHDIGDWKRKDRKVGKKVRLSSDRHQAKISEEETKIYVDKTVFFLVSHDFRKKCSVQLLQTVTVIYFYFYLQNSPTFGG